MAEEIIIRTDSDPDSEIESDAVAGAEAAAALTQAYEAGAEAGRVEATTLERLLTLAQQVADQGDEIAWIRDSLGTLQTQASETLALLSTGAVGGPASQPSPIDQLAAEELAEEAEAAAAEELAEDSGAPVLEVEPVAAEGPQRRGRKRTIRLPW